jgi:hypothetical protein
MSLFHLAKCSARSITTADFLSADAIRDEIPTDPQTRDDFGFSRCRTRNEESHLLGLYQGMVAVSDDVYAPDVHEWRQQGILADKIIEYYTRIPEGHRGSYFQWFTRNRHILDPSVPPIDLNKIDNDPLYQAIEAARPYLDPEDRGKEVYELQPQSKSYCFIFYAMALQNSRPHPNWVELDLWYDFGFATCPVEYSENGLGCLYNRLVGGNKRREDYSRSLGSSINSLNRPQLATCPFSEFWQAWESRSLPQLFNKYGLASDAHLQHFLTFPANRPRPLVWRLRHLLALNDNTPLNAFPEIETAAMEYGFAQNLDPRTKMELLKFYKELLAKGDALEVHEARSSGKLLEYAGTCVTSIDERVKKVLKRLC